MAHGLGGTKLMGLAAYAEQFSAAGYACIVFDYRRWGRSDGTRRNSVYISEQLDDYRSVVEYARLQTEYDPQRVILWGFSASGGHVLALASEPSLNVAAGMALNAFCGLHPPKPRLNWWLIKHLAFGFMDLFSNLLDLEPLYIRLVQPPGKLALFTDPGACEGYYSITEDPSDFPNQIAASFVLRAMNNQPARDIHRIKRPLLLVAAQNDGICPPSQIVDTSRIIPTAELIEVPGDHFDIFRGNSDWERSIESQLAFLTKHFPL